MHVPTVPLFPLRTVLVPGLVLPLHIFEPRYRLMVSTLAEAPEDERGFGIVAMRPGCTEADGRAGIYEMGTMARITRVDALPDGRYDIVTVGARRFSIESLDDALPYTRAQVRLHDEPIGEPGTDPCPGGRRRAPARGVPRRHRRLGSHPDGPHRQPAR